MFLQENGFLSYKISRLHGDCMVQGLMEDVFALVPQLEHSVLMNLKGNCGIHIFVALSGKKCKFVTVFPAYSNDASKKDR